MNMMLWIANFDGRVPQVRERLCAHMRVLTRYIVSVAGDLEASAAVDGQADLLDDTTQREHERHDARPPQGRDDAHLTDGHARARRAGRAAHRHLVQEGACVVCT
jgi:hypothetical protein